MAVGRHGGRLLHRGALDREMPLQPRGKDLSFRVLAQAFRSVLANECQQLGLVLPPAIMLMLAGVIQRIQPVHGLLRRVDIFKA